MPLELARRSMLDQLRQRGATVDQVDAFGVAWNGARARGDAEMPCAVCFLGDVQGKLKIVPAERGASISRCTACNNDFIFVDMTQL